jgi:transposase-like protein
MDRSMAARIGGMDRQTLRDWVHRFNEHGPIGLINVKPTGRRPKLSVEQQEALRQLVAGDVLHGGFPVQSVEERLKKGLREVSANLPLSRKLPKSTSTPLSDIVEIPGEFFPSSSQDRVTAAGRCVAGRSSPRIGPKADLGVT